jgi:DNA repair exonuclease SbcCD ATPase subunit
MFDESLDVELAKSLGQEDLEGRLAEIEQQRQDAVAEAERKAQRTDAEREAEKAAALAEVEEQRAQALDRLKQEHADRVKAAEDALAAAKAELAGAREKARQKRAEAEDQGGPSQRRPRDVLAGLEDRLKDIGDTLARKISVTGTFNPMAVWGLGGASAIERTAKATETTAKNTGRLVEAATTGGLAFA